LPVGACAAVRVPATSANLGPGFDAFGLALALHDEVAVEVAGSGLRIEVAGECADVVPRDERHLVLRALRTGLAAAHADPPGLIVRCTNRIPHGRGLGSSAAAVVAGLTLARALAPVPSLADDELLRLAVRFEGHADNVAACLLGGLTVAWHGRTGLRATHLDVSPAVRAVAAVPDHVLSTHAARGMLPADVPHADAAANAGRAALLVHALAGRPDLLLDATEDLLHQDYREAGMPDSLALVRRLRALGLPAVVSGAGPTVLVLGTDGPALAAAVTAQIPHGWHVVALAVDADGAHVTARSGGA
jgi:homoserine kinase